MTQTLSWRRRHIKFFGGRAVVIVRSPYRALISYWNHQVPVYSFTSIANIEKKFALRFILTDISDQKSADHHTGLAPKASFMGSKFAEFALGGADKWLALISDWLKLGNQVLISVLIKRQQI